VLRGFAPGSENGDQAEEETPPAQRVRTEEIRIQAGRGLGVATQLRLATTVPSLVRLCLCPPRCRCLMGDLTSALAAKLLGTGGPRIRPAPFGFPKNHFPVLLFITSSPPITQVTAMGVIAFNLKEFMLPSKVDPSRQKVGSSQLVWADHALHTFSHRAFRPRFLPAVLAIMLLS